MNIITKFNKINIMTKLNKIDEYYNQIEQK